MTALYKAYSRGQKQRTALARALLVKPKLLLLDEPTTGLDTEGLNELTKTLRQQRMDGKTIAVVTHDAQWGGNICDTSIRLVAGKVVGGLMNDVLKTAYSIAQKDLRIESRSKEIVVTTTLFASLMIVLSALSFYIDPLNARQGGTGHDVAGDFVLGHLDHEPKLGARIAERRILVAVDEPRVHYRNLPRQIRQHMDIFDRRRTHRDSLARHLFST